MKATKARSGPESNTRIQAERRHQLIEATLTSIAEVGLPNVTLAKVAGYAGLTAAMVNFHFSGKESLMLETLRFVSREFQDRFEAAVTAAKGDPVKALDNIVAAHFDRELSDRRRLAVWYAFWAERRSRADYQEICGAHDKAYEHEFKQLFTRLVELEGRPDMDADALAMAFMGMLDFLWQGLMVDETIGARKVRSAQCRRFLESIFPKTMAGSATAADTGAPPAVPPVAAASKRWVCVCHIDDLKDAPVEDADVAGRAIRVSMDEDAQPVATVIDAAGTAGEAVALRLVDGMIFLRP